MLLIEGGPRRQADRTIQSFIHPPFLNDRCQPSPRRHNSNPLSTPPWASPRMQPTLPSLTPSIKSQLPRSTLLPPFRSTSLPFSLPPEQTTPRCQDCARTRHNNPPSRQTRYHFTPPQKSHTLPRPHPHPHPLFILVPQTKQEPSVSQSSPLPGPSAPSSRCLPMRRPSPSLRWHVR
ncbi:hypothetical protein N658DRAFT_165827 [Parathielavia hyrcaniae]|uniref:Uncharacterized protein n=1 Tax=Parathielavia hyrcaniae TaxID=113614 RepID=A0AAN6Q1X3_9PEZI|nr:hypothetical protein N658DRAFT_165827 [Parathielavia hyrcaniae]